jgi:hypothetical protein
MAGNDVVSAAGVVGATLSRSSDHAVPTVGCRASGVGDMHRSRHAVFDLLLHIRERDELVDIQALSTQPSG